MSDTCSRSARLYLRAEPELGAEQSKQAVVDRLSTLRRAGTLDRVEIRPWGKRIRLDGPLVDTDHHASILRSIEEFERWAEARGLSLDCAFERREVRSPITGEAYPVISLPVICLAVYRDGELHGVSPCDEGDHTRTVHEMLEELDEPDSDGVRSTVTVG